MPDDLREGTATISSCCGKVGVGMTRIASQTVKLHAPVTQWRIKRVEGKANTYHLGVGGYAITYVDDKEIWASIEGKPQEWLIVYNSFYDKYTIEIDGKSRKGWVVVGDPSSPKPQALQIGALTPSYPPQPLFSGELFTFRFLD